MDYVAQTVSSAEVWEILVQLNVVCKESHWVLRRQVYVACLYLFGKKGRFFLIGHSFCFSVLIVIEQERVFRRAAADQSCVLLLLITLSCSLFCCRMCCFYSFAAFLVDFILLLNLDYCCVLFLFLFCDNYRFLYHCKTWYSLGFATII